MDEVLKALMTRSSQGFALFDRNDRLRYANATFREMHGIGETFPTWVELMRRSRASRVGTDVITDDFEAWLAAALSRRGKLPDRSFETNLLDGRWMLVTETTAENGEMLCVFTDITALGANGRALRQARDRAQREALTDELTHLSNRRHLLDRLNALLASGGHHELAVVLLDLDHFKRINDTHGHEVGDRVLKHFAAQLQSHIRRDDVAGRFGGEEFMLALPGATLDNAQAALDRLFETVRNSRPCPELPALRYTCSGGLALALPGESSHALLRRVDAALYQAKGDGRDRYAVAG